MSSKTAAKSRSLAARLTFWYAATTFVLTLGVTVWLYSSLARNLRRENDESLDDQARVVRGLLRERPGDLDALRREVEWESLTRRRSRIFLRVVDGRGSVVTETPGMTLPSAAFPAPVEEPQHGLTLRGPEGRGYRVIAVHVGDHLILAALDRSDDEELLAKFGWGTIPVVLVMLAVSGFLGHRIARRGVRPVEEIAEVASRIRPTKLHERIASTGLPTELATLARIFNEMLDRLEEAFTRISRFSADIAHELRTPLNNVRGEVEVALGRDRPAEEYRELLGSCLEECGRLSRIVDSLLFLARAENPETHVSRERLSVARELEKVREFYAVGAEEKGVTLAVSAGDFEMELDRTLFQRALGNLVENALTHTPKGGTITLAAVTSHEGARVEVADTGCGISADHLPRVFDRFYRVDASRTGGHVGLGLAIVKSIVDLHGGSVEVHSEPGRGTRVTLCLPQMTKT